MSKSIETSIEPGITRFERITCVRYRAVIGSRYLGMFETLEEARAARAAEMRPREKKQSQCKTCIWRRCTSDSKAAMSQDMCNYSLAFGHQSRLKRYYDRTGAKTPEGLNKGPCYEYMEGNPNDTKSLYTQDVSKNDIRGIRVLKRERGEDVTELQEKQRVHKNVKVDKEKMESLGMSAVELGKLIGRSKHLVYKARRTGEIAEKYAIAILNKTGIDIRRY